MNTELNVAEILKRPSAVLPIAMSFTALVVVLAHITMFEVVRDADEGGAAHIW